MSEQYKISLGVDVDVSDIQSQINNKAKDTSIPVKLEIENIGDIKRQIQSLGGIKGSIDIPLTIDTNSAIKSAQQVGQKIGSSVTRSVRQSMNIDDVIDKQVTDLMKKFSVTGKKGSESFNAIRQALVECRNELNILKNSDIGIDAKVFDSSRAIDKVTDAIANQHRAVNVLGDDYVKLAEYMKKTNDPKKGYKIQVPDFIKQEQGDDYRSNRSSLGIAFTTGKGTSFVDFINQLNGDLGHTIDLTKGEAEAFDELLRKVEIGRQQLKALEQSQKSLNANSSTYEILGQNGINREEIYSNVMSIMNVIDNAEKQIAQASSKATNIITQNENEKQQAYKATTDAVVYHAGVVSKLNKAETNGRFYGSNRGTGYFGTGHYFVDSATKHELDNSPSYRNLPYTSIDISQYDNLFKVTNDEIGYALHSFLGNLTRFTQGSDNFDVDELFAQFKKVFGDTVMDIKEFGSRVDKLKTFMTNSDFYDRSDSVSTQFMKSLGYGGVDTRGTSLADTRYGTVIYDLKEESVLQANITDELQKQGQMLEKINYERGQVFDRETDARIQGQLDEEIKRKETIAEFEKSFDSTNLDFASESLDNAKNRIKELDKCINECQYSLNNLDEEYKDHVRDMSVMGLDEEDLWLVEDEDEWKNGRLEAYKDYINEASQEKERLQSEIPALEEVYTRESQLANEAYEQAKQVVEQRHKEAQQAQETANVVVQNEERKQQARQQTANTIKSIAKETSLIRNDVGFKRVFDSENQSAKEAQRYFQALLAEEKATVSVKESFDNSIGDGKALKSFTVDIQRASGEVEKLHYAMSDIEDDNRFLYQGGSVSDKSIEKQTEARIRSANKLQTELEEIRSKYKDMGAAKPIKDSDHISSLDKQYRKVEKAIDNIRNADNATSSSMISNAEKQKSVLESMVREYRNAETVATSLRSKDIGTVKSTYSSDLDVLIQKMKDAGVYTSGFEKGAENLRSVLSNATDPRGLVSFLNGFDKLEAGYKRAAQYAKSFTQATTYGQRAHGLGSDVKNLQRIDPEINRFEAEINGAKVSVQSLLNELSQVKTKSDFQIAEGNFKAFKKAAEAAGIKVKETVAETNSDFNKLKSLAKEINSLEFKIAGLDANKNEAEINELIVSLERLYSEYDRLFSATSKNLSGSQVSQLDDIFAKAGDKLRQLDAEIADTKSKLANGIKLDIELGNFENEIDTMRSKFNSLSDANDDLRRSVELVENAYQDMLNASKANTGDEVADRERLIEAEKKYAAALEKTNNLIKIQARADRVSEANRRLEDSHKSLELDMVNWLKKNSKAAKEYEGHIYDLIEALRKLEKEGNLQQIDVNSARSKFNLIDKDAERRGLKGLTVFDQIKSKFKQYASYLSAAEAFMYAEQALRSMFEQVKLIDSAMTELKKVTDETDASYNKFLKDAGSRAKELGTTIDGLVSSTADFARLGYDFKDAQGLAEVANIYAVVGDDIEGVEGATESLISTMAAFKDEMNGMSDTDFAMSIIDVYNEIGNNFAISSGGLGEALERSASSLAAGNNTLHESAALITAANEVVQNPEKVGNAMKTVSMRIRSAKSEMEEMGEDTEGMVESTATLRAEIKALSGVDIMASATEFKSTYQILDELSKKWEDLSDISRATIIEKMAGRSFARMCRNVYKEYI